MREHSKTYLEHDRTQATTQYGYKQTTLFNQQRSILSFILIGFLLLSFIFLMPTPAQAQLKTVEKLEPSIEQKVDQAFGTIVGYMANVLLWDVAFWDNQDPLTIRSTIPSKQSLIDPLGWGLFTQDESSIQLIDFNGEILSKYSIPQLKIKQAWSIQAGREILVLSEQDELFFFKRNVKGNVEKALGPYRLPEGSLSYFTEIDSKLIFGTNQGLIYQLHHQVGEALTNQSLQAINLTLDEPIMNITARADGLYWLVSGLNGAFKVIEAPKKSTLVNVVIDVKRPSQITGKFLKTGFTDHQIWVALEGGLFTWDTQKNQLVFALQFPSISSVSAIKDQKGQSFYFVSSNQDSFHVISDQGAEIQIDINPSSPLHQKQLKHCQTVEQSFWCSDETDLYQLSLNTQDKATLMVNTHLKQGEEVTMLAKSGGHLVAQGQQKLKLWFKADFQLPLIVLWLVFGALFFTLRMRFVNLRLFKHAIEVVKGKYTDPNSVGEVSHFQALTSALSATVGLGNIAGVAIAIGLGGPGATFWMIVAGFLGMASKFTECTLGQKYRTVSKEGEVMGGAMHYLSKGLASERNMPILGKTLAILFSFLCIGGSFGGGNAFQVKQSLEAVAEVVPVLAELKWIYGLIMAIAVGVVILGGIKSIAQTAEKIVPAMCGIYILASLYVIIVHIDLVPQAISEIIGGAFSPDAIYGGAVGVLVVGFKRAAFSNEAGIGSAAIAHAAAKTDYPVREGIVALLEPFIDTIIVCTMTALVIVITGAYHNPEYGALVVGNKGAALTSQAMGEVISFFPYVLSVAVILFAYSTMISWSYYGERCWAWLFGENAMLFSMGKHASLIYKILFLVFAFLGSIVTATNILDFSDLMILGMALPNIFGILFLSRGVRIDLDAYEAKLNANEFPIYEASLEQEKQENQENQEG